MTDGEPIGKCMPESDASTPPKSGRTAGFCPYRAGLAGVPESLDDQGWSGDRKLSG